MELLSTPLNSNLIQQTQPVVDVTLLWFLVKTHCSISSPPGAAPRQPQCEGLWVFSPLRVKDYGWLTAFVWRGEKKKRENIGAQHVGASVNNSSFPGSPGCSLMCCWAARGPHKAERHNRSAVGEETLTTGQRHATGTRHSHVGCLSKSPLRLPLFSARGLN